MGKDIKRGIITIDVEVSEVNGGVLMSQEVTTDGDISFADTMLALANQIIHYSRKSDFSKDDVLDFMSEVWDNGTNVK